MTKMIYYILFFSLVISEFAFASTYEKVERQGVVTYNSSQNVYVKFESTNGIVTGDTLYQKLSNKLIPAMVVKFISAKSVAGESINNTELKVDDRLFAVIEREIPDLVTNEPNTPEVSIPTATDVSVNTINISIRS